MTMETQLYKVDEVAELLKCSAATVRSLIKSGDLPHILVGKRPRVRGDDLWRFCEKTDKKD